MGWYCAGGGGRARPGVVNEETRWVRENERVRSADQGWCGGGVVCVPEKNPYNPIGTMYSCEFARLSGCSRVFGH